MSIKNALLRPKSSLSVLTIPVVLIFLASLLVAFKTEAPTTYPVAQAAKQQLLLDLTQLQAKAAQLTEILPLLARNQATLVQARQIFHDVKKAYKRTEYLTEYLDPDLARKINGAPLPKVVVSEADYLALGLTEPLFSTTPPEGLQVLEDLLFAEEKPDAAAATALAHQLAASIGRLATNVQPQPLTDKQVLESLQEEVLRVLTMGITGFDAPGAGSEMEFAATALAPVLTAAQGYASSGPAQARSQQAVLSLQKAIAYLQQSPDFDTFDRVHFIREIGNPAYVSVTALQPILLAGSGFETALVKPVNNQATGLFDQEFLRTAYYAKQDRNEQVPAQLELGKLLFFDPVLSANNQRSCASCHNPAKAFTDGEAKSRAFADGATVGRNAPTLLNAIFSTAYFWDARAGFLEDQIPEVVRKPDELHTSYEEIIRKLQQSSAYQKLFKQAFKTEGNNTLNTSTVNRALAAYLRSLVALNAPFDKYMRHETDALSASARRGANLFMGKAACATCHFAPIFNGTVPPRFLESETEVIGVPLNADLTQAQPDPDQGRGQIVKADVLRGAFKTPTVRNVALTAPYMHNGVFQTLEEVVEFYNRGGGAGLGLIVPNQTLPFDNLSLTEQEKKDLVAFLETLTDATSSHMAPGQLPAFPASTSLHNRPVGGKY